MLFALPVLIFGRSVGNDMEGYNVGGRAMIVTLIIAIFVVVWTIKRLHDLNKSGWFTLLLLPPFTIVLLPYVLFWPSQNENNRWGGSHSHTTFFGIRLRGAFRIAGAIFTGALMLYLVLLFASFTSY